MWIYNSIRLIGGRQFGNNLQFKMIKKKTPNAFGKKYTTDQSSSRLLADRPQPCLFAGVCEHVRFILIFIGHRCGSLLVGCFYCCNIVSLWWCIHWSCSWCSVVRVANQRNFGFEWDSFVGLVMSICCSRCCCYLWQMLFIAFAKLHWVNCHKFNLNIKNYYLVVVLHSGMKCVWMRNVNIIGGKI